MLERKSDKVRRYVACGAYKQALAIAKDFMLGISREDTDAMTRGYECMVHPGFYSQLGIDENIAIQKAVDTVKRLYGG